MRVFGKINNAIKNYVKEYVRFLMIPASFCGTSFSFMTMLTVLTDFKIGIDVFTVAQNPYFIIGIGILSFFYIWKFYPEHLNSKSNVGWIRKTHKPFAMFSGLFAAFTVYYFPQLGLLFHTVASQTNFDLTTIMAPVGPFEVPAIYALPVIVIAFTSFTKEMFLSCNDKPRLWLSTQESYTEKFIKKLLVWIRNKANQ